MTTMPDGSNPTASRGCTYDAWNRLIIWIDPSDTGARYAYDGLNRRVKAERLVNDTVTETRHFYYSAAWQVLEERLGTTPNTADADRQFVWGLRYIDDLVLRDRDASSTPDGVLEERLYALQDPNWNVTAICESDGDVVERYAYSAYGDTRLLDEQYASRTTTTYAWETKYAGYRWDAPTGLYCVRNRYLHAGLGGWVTRDPLSPRDINLYRYVVNSPVRFVDPSGLILAAVDGTQSRITLEVAVHSLKPALRDLAEPVIK